MNPDNEGLPPINKLKKKKRLKTNPAATSLACPGVIPRPLPDQPLMLVLFHVTV